ncbi:elongation factor P 5-aminopentanone reductase [Salipaludibacillus aurantiacus]|uniref:3-oxoacyl-[acyl-carrier protein] reductase n=1 Tax=Salipaludibacillus aurantiacus TaxID=1601833 RepID=A0A1H9QGP6_9BACI|nr:SDR family oxidoreductase [Salipaludibacillus aurantiacus]SER59375.1 3-oxoacyl-[acyl-carrier protein] reductase [Salipaludibacillus aurantiacus]
MNKTAPEAFITGASGGIGRAISLKMASAGYNVILHYCRNKQAAEILKSEIEEKYGLQAVLFQADFTDIKGTEAKLLSLNPAPDVLIHNSGTADTRLFQDETMDNLTSRISAGLTAPSLLTKLVLPSMISKKKGKIIMITSIWGLTGAACEVTYSMIKGGQNSFVKALAKEVAPSGIQVNGVAPGAIETGMLACYTDEDMHELKQEIPAGRLGLPEEVASAAAFLASDEASYINGQILSVNGAWHC